MTKQLLFILILSLLGLSVLAGGNTGGGSTAPPVGGGQSTGGVGEGGPVTVTNTSVSQTYCNTDLYVTVFGTGFVSQEIFDYTLTLTGENCSALHATTLVQVVSETELKVGVDSFAGCTSLLYATLSYQNQSVVGPVAIAFRNVSCPIFPVTVTNTSDLQTYCNSDLYVTVNGTGFISQAIFDYTLTITGEGCSALHATTLVQVVSETQLKVGPDSLVGCTGLLYVTLNYQNQGVVGPVAIATLDDSCPQGGESSTAPPVGGGQGSSTGEGHHCPQGSSTGAAGESSTAPPVGGGQGSSSTGEDGGHCGCSQQCGWKWVCAEDGADNLHGVPCCGWQWFCATPPPNGTQTGSGSESENCEWRLSCSADLATQSAQCIWNLDCASSSNDECWSLTCRAVAEGSSTTGNERLDDMLRDALHGVLPEGTEVSCEWNQCSNNPTAPVPVCGYRLQCEGNASASAVASVEASQGSFEGELSADVSCSWGYVCPSSGSSTGVGGPSPSESSTGCAGGEDASSSSSSTGSAPPVGTGGGGDDDHHCGWCWACENGNQAGHANKHCPWKWYCPHNVTTTPPQCNWRYLCVGDDNNCTCSWTWYCGNDDQSSTGGGVGEGPGPATNSSEYCNTDQYVTLYGSGFVSQEIFDYTVTLSGEGCSGLHATTLVKVVSETELLVGPDNLAGCTGVIYATLNYQNQGAQEPVAVATRNESCPILPVSVTDTSASQTYCNLDGYVTVTGTGFLSQEIFDYTLTLTGEGCTALHATTLVQVVSDTELRAGPDGLDGCSGLLYATLNYQNQGALEPVAIASYSATCTVVGGNGHYSQINGVAHLTFNVAVVALSAVLAYVF